MRSLLNVREHSANLRQLLVWTLLVVPVGILSGSASAFFLWSLDLVTEIHWANPWLLFLLPLAGVVVGWTYHRVGKSAEGGNNLILDQIHEPGGGVPTRMAPLILVSTLVTHLFGGSAGREGTAVQMGGSLASAYGRLCKFGGENMRILLMAGVAAGFGSVFGTPLTGAIFAMEVLVIGRVQYDALIPVLVASVVGDLTCSDWGVHHAIYHIGIADGASQHAFFDGLLMAKVVLAAIVFGLTSQLFAELTHGLAHTLKKIVPSAPLRAALGGLLVIGLVYLVGSRDYLGLGVRSHDPQAVTILSAFAPGGAHAWSWWWKLLFTAVTLSAGFKGGEVTPLFFIGATLANTLAVLLGAPVDLFAGLGFIAVFAGATNTPLACTVMGIELFGSHYTVYFAVACFVAYYVSGHPHFVGNHRFAHELGVCNEDVERRLATVEGRGHSVVVVGHRPHDGCKGEVLGIIAIGDTLRENAATSIRALHDAGVVSVMMLSGDNQRTVDFIAKQVGIDEPRGDLLPDDKVTAVKALREKHGIVGMVGDGVNDAPAMATASTGIAMGMAGTDAAIETADITLMKDDLGKIAETILLARRVMNIIRFNITFSLALKVVFLVLTLMGSASLWLAILADTGATLLVVANALRLLRPPH